MITVKIIILIYLVLILGIFSLKYIWDVLKKISANQKKKLYTSLMNEEIKKYISKKLETPKDL